jgi:hypothetical protein
MEDHSFLLLPLPLTTLCGFWFSQRRHSKLFYPLLIPSNFSLSAPLGRQIHHPTISILVFPVIAFLLVSIQISFILLAVLEVSVLCMRPNHLILWALINLTISCPLITWPNLALFLILHIYFPICIGPKIFRKICLSKTRIRISTFLVSVHVSEANVTTGHMRVRYILIFVLLSEISILKVLHLRNRLCFFSYS